MESKRGALVHSGARGGRLGGPFDTEMVMDEGSSKNGKWWLLRRALESRFLRSLAPRRESDGRQMSRSSL